MKIVLMRRDVANVLATAALVGIVAATAGGCTSSTGTDSAPAPAATEAAPTDPAADAPPACEAALEGACGDCMKTSCCDALTACEADADCQACVTGKDSDACERTTETHERVNAYLVCKGGACKTPCIGAAGGACAGMLDGVATSTCQACLEAKCCDEVAACHAKDVCWDGCLTNHDETKCHGDPDAHAVFHSLSACVTASCSTECN
jgi:hypothetical protein